MSFTDRSARAEMDARSSRDLPSRRLALSEASADRISSSAGYVGGEGMDSVAVEIAAGVVLGGPWVGMSGEDLGVAERDSGAEGIGDRGMA